MNLYHEEKNNSCRIGKFRGNLAIKLTEDGHEVFGVDRNPSKVDYIQNKINHAIGLDASDDSCINHLPIDDCDLVVIAIGENIGASVTTTALIKNIILVGSSSDLCLCCIKPFWKRCR
ncbi:MAG: NAD-binding protein [Saprospiraceae bacterium]|nr:NAD-binding protein [Saprospiraceae bacterium]